jgi:hypothetical protein
VEGAVLPGDALADHAGALVDEHRRRRRGSRGEAPRLEEAGSGGPNQVRRAASGGHGAELEAAAAAPFPPHPTLFDLFQVLGCLCFPYFVFGLLRSILAGEVGSIKTSR